MDDRLQLTIIDTEDKFLKPAEEEFIRRYSAQAEIQMITDPEYEKKYFESGRKIDVLIINQGAYGDFLEEQDIRHIFLMVSEIEADKSYPDKVTVLMDYVPMEEMMQKIDAAMKPADAGQEESPEEEEENRVTRIVAVYSPIGGCGKSLASLALGRKLKKLDQKVLLIGCDATQSLSVFLDPGEYAGEDLAEALKNPSEDTYWMILQNIERDEVSYLRPFEKSLPLLEIGMKEWDTLVSLLLEKKDFDYLILDMGTVLDQDASRLLKKADSMLLISENNDIAGRKMQRLLKNSELLPSCDCIMAANEISISRMKPARNGIFGTIPHYDDWEDVMEDPIFYRIALRITE